MKGGIHSLTVYAKPNIYPDMARHFVFLPGTCELALALSNHGVDKDTTLQADK